MTAHRVRTSRRYRDLFVEGVEHVLCLDLQSEPPGFD